MGGLLKKTISRHVARSVKTRHSFGLEGPSFEELEQISYAHLALKPTTMLDFAQHFPKNVDTHLTKARRARIRKHERARRVTIKRMIEHKNTPAKHTAA